MSGRAPIPELAILTPLYEPAVGGAGVYYPLLARTLLDAGVAGRVTVDTEAHPGRPTIETAREGRLAVRRILPHRAGAPVRQCTRHVRYAVANVAYGHLLRRAWPAGSALLVHASLHYPPGLLGPVAAGLARRRHRPRLVADARDPRLPHRRQKALAPYDRVIACGQGVAAHLGTMPVARGKIATIPVPIERPSQPAAPAETARRYGLRPGRDILWPHGVLWRKNLDRALTAVARARNQGAPDLRLAIVGGARDWNRRVSDAVDAGVAAYLGPIPPAAMPALDAAAAGVVDVAEVEGVPRAMLEAMAVGARVVLPPAVPEFAAQCPDHLAATGNPDQLARQLAQLATGRWSPAPYPLADHDADRLAPAYAQVLASPEEPCAS